MDSVTERRFGGLGRLYGETAAHHLFSAHVMVVGIGGVGSWAAEALGRSGIRHLSLVDLDHIAESNINRQVHALENTLGQSKVLAMRERLLQIHPGMRVDVVDDFVTPDNWPTLGQTLLDSPSPVALLDACDQMSAKEAMAAWARRQRIPFVTVGAAGGKRQGDRVEVADLSATTHDPLLAQLRYRLRKRHGAPREGRIGVTGVFSREPVAPPHSSCEQPSGDGTLNCHGYGSSVVVTATFGFCAAGVLIEQLLRRAPAV